ncbi:MAG: hypothetical protein ACE37H_04835 [Phycisphaeraceae bacterium]
MSDALQRLLEIDRAIRRPGGLTELIQHQPDTEAWLAWMIQAHANPTCGALEEIQAEQEGFSTPELSPEVDTMSGRSEVCPIRLLDVRQVSRPAYSLGRQNWRFAVESSVAYRLLAQDGTLLWTGDLSAQSQTQQDPLVWHLAAASDPDETLVQRWPLPRWMLTVEHHRLEAGDYLDVLNYEEVS